MKKLPFRSPIDNAPVFYKRVTGSTMEDAKALAASGCGHGSVILTDYQKAGRGRRGNRRWDSERGANLLFTLILRKDAAASTISSAPLLVGLAASLLLEERFNVRPEIKWPNDVLVEGKKIAGILCVLSGDFLLAGVGLNCNQVRFPEGISGSATSIALETGKETDRWTLLVAFLESVRNQLANPDWADDVRARLFGRGKPCLFVLGEGAAEMRRYGVPLGLGESGELVYEDSETGKQERLFSGTYKINPPRQAV